MAVVTYVLTGSTVIEVVVTSCGAPAVTVTVFVTSGATTPVHAAVSVLL